MTMEFKHNNGVDQGKKLCVASPMASSMNRHSSPRFLSFCFWLLLSPKTPFFLQCKGLHLQKVIDPDSGIHYQLQ